MGTIENKIIFTSHVKKLTRKANQELHALTRVRHYIDGHKHKLFFSYFVKSQFGYCPLTWMLCSKPSIHRINNVHEKSWRLISQDYDSNFESRIEQLDMVLTLQPLEQTNWKKVPNHIKAFSSLESNRISGSFQKENKTLEM